MFLCRIEFGEKRLLFKHLGLTIICRYPTLSPRYLSGWLASVFVWHGLCQFVVCWGLTRKVKGNLGKGRLAQNFGRHQLLSQFFFFQPVCSFVFFLTSQIKVHSHNQGVRGIVFFTSRRDGSGTCKKSSGTGTGSWKILNAKNNISSLMFTTNIITFAYYKQRYEHTKRWLEHTSNCNFPL